MKKVFALVAFTAIFTASTFAQETKSTDNTKAPVATEKKAACCAKANAACCKNNKDSKACTHDQKAACEKAGKSAETTKSSNGTK